MPHAPVSFAHAITLLMHAVPDPIWWSGTAAQSCAARIEELITELHSLEHRINSGWHS